MPLYECFAMMACSVSHAFVPLVRRDAYPIHPAGHVSLSPLARSDYAVEKQCYVAFLVFCVSL